MAGRADKRARAARAGAKAAGATPLEIAKKMEVPLDEAETLAEAINMLGWALEYTDGPDVIRPIHAVVAEMQARLAFLQKSMRLLMAACEAAAPLTRQELLHR